MDDLRDQTAVVTGGSRGFGRGIVEALAAAGMRVVAVARDPGALAALAREVKGRVETVAADATDPVTAARVIDRERPRVLVLNAGATGPHRPTRLQTWETHLSPPYGQSRSGAPSGKSGRYGRASSTARAKEGRASSRRR